MNKVQICKSFIHHPFDRYSEKISNASQNVSGQSKAGGHAQSNFDSKALATDALSMANPNPTETAAVGAHAHPNHTAEKSNQGSNSEGGTSPDTQCAYSINPV